MLKQLSAIKNSIYRSLGIDSDSTDATTSTEVDLRINEAQDIIAYDRDWEWRKRTFYYTLRTPYITGTITVTKGSKTVTGSGTTFTEFHKTGYLKVNSKLFKIDSYDSATQLTLKSMYPDTTESGVTTSIVFPDFYLHPDIAAVLRVDYEGLELVVKSKARLLNERSALGAPEEAAFNNVTDEDFYNTGTVDISNGSTTVTGTNTVWTSEMEDMPFRVSEFGEVYVVKSVDSSTSLTLHKAYRGETGSGKAYAIAPKGSTIFTVTNTPDDYYFLTIEALVKPEMLVDGNDYSMIPNHTPLIHAARWLILQEMEDKNPVRIQQARADFQRTLKQLQSMYKVVTNIRWRSQSDRMIRRSGGITRFNPLEG